MAVSKERALLSHLRLAADQVALWAYGPPPLLLVAKLDDGYPSRVGGYGGWEDVERPGQVSATVYKGTGSQQLPLRLILGGWPVDPRSFGLSCARQITVLERMARQPVGAARGDRPPLLSLRGPVPHGGARWFIADVVWDDESAIVVDGQVQRQQVTVTLQQFVPIQLVAIRTRRATRPPVRHKVRKGDTLQSIARDRLMLRGSRAIGGGVAAIKRLNRIRDPRTIRPGRWLKLPAMQVGHGE